MRWVPYWMERMDSHAEKLAYTVPVSRRSRASTSPAAVASSRSRPTRHFCRPSPRCIGEDQLVYASDYPHYDANLDAIPELVARTDLTDAQKRKFLARQRQAAVHSPRIGPKPNRRPRALP